MILVVLGVVAVVLLTVNIEDLRQASSTGAAIIAPAQSSSGEYKAARAKGGVRYTGRYVNGTREEVDTPRILLNVQAVGKRVGTRIYPLLADEAREGPAGVQRNNARNLDVECLEGVSTNSSEQQGRWPAGCCSGGSLEVGVSSQVKMLLIDRGAPFFRGSRQLTLRSLTCCTVFLYHRRFVSVCMQSTSYILSFRMVLFYLVTTGWTFDISFCENQSISSINRSNPLSTRFSLTEYGDEQADAGRDDCRTSLPRPNSQARRRTGKYSAFLFS